MSANQGPKPRCSSHTHRRALILVDLSVEQMSAVERHDADAIVANLIRLVTAREEASFTKESQNSATGIFHLGIDCRLWLKSPQESSLSKVWPEAGRTMFVADSDGASLIPELGAIIQSSRHDNPTAGIPWIFVPKNNYSCFANTQLHNILQEHDISTVYIAGINTDYCIFATALDAFSYHYDTYVIRDAVTSVRGRNAHDEGLHNLTRHFGETILVTTDQVGVLSLACQQE